MGFDGRPDGGGGGALQADSLPSAGQPAAAAVAAAAAEGAMLPTTLGRQPVAGPRAAGEDADGGAVRARINAWLATIPIGERRAISFGTPFTFNNSAPIAQLDRAADF